MIDVPDEGFEVSELRQSTQPGTRQIYHRQGIRIILKQTGDIGAFSFESALLTCTTSLGLFAVARVIVDLMLMTANRFAMHHGKPACLPASQQCRRRHMLDGCHAGLVLEETDKVHELTVGQSMSAVRSAATKPTKKVRRRGAGPAGAGLTSVRRFVSSVHNTPLRRRANMTVHQAPYVYCTYRSLDLVSEI